jgi:hypothetical protein
MPYKDIEKRKAASRRRYANNVERERAWRKKSRDANPEQTKNLRLKSVYGITLENFKAMQVAQSNRCAICQKDFGAEYSNRPHVDHCHTTEVVRGLLCDRCNVGLGFLEHSEFVSSALVYLGKASLP